MAGLFALRVFARNLLRRSRRRNIFILMPDLGDLTTLPTRLRRLLSRPRKRWALTKKVDNSLLFLSGTTPTSQKSLNWSRILSTCLPIYNTIFCKNGQCNEMTLRNTLKNTYRTTLRILEEGIVIVRN